MSWVVLLVVSLWLGVVSSEASGVAARPRVGCFCSKVYYSTPWLYENGGAMSVFRAQIIHFAGRRPVTRERMYLVRVQRFFKGCPSQGSFALVASPCGVALPEGEVVLLFGDRNDSSAPLDEYHLTRCNGFRMWSAVLQEQNARKYLERRRDDATCTYPCPGCPDFGCLNGRPPPPCPGPPCGDENGFGPPPRTCPVENSTCYSSFCGACRYGFVGPDGLIILDCSP
mmetsp:Transcript_100/g.168  ORF Transcript_100/g.168 Transcript_100/m.168 type:complete len:227 (+) Transcript_100:243-923(+)|eukprot:CAMPEP_0184677986 /NCGR_PEP_ID=MMETSP0312-20130426/623_1 /TAXON_ID=31354 /ORGANISM="Compsopogon coeruleus, Strain SAG 36.94" /LENGTH=226 /DNA_ID=CAMNT_0027126289 /DNA_START=146 /DNA_END=826 /DNA_ORIENTATION=-